MKRTKWIAFLCFAFLMAGLGANDALRGIFAPVFQERYDLNGSQLSLIVTISYVGNLLFLSIGGKLLDLFPRKECGCGGNGCLGGSSCPKSGVRQLYMDSGIHVFCSGSIHPFKYYGQYIDSGGVRRICGPYGKCAVFYPGDWHQRKPASAGKIRLPLCRMEMD